MSLKRERQHNQYRDHGAPVSGSTPHAALRAWMRAQALDTAAIEVLESWSLRGFLQQTSHIAMPSGERLRELAILIEPVAVAASQPQGWRLLQRVYVEAAQHAPETPWLGHSQARSALACLDRRLSQPIFDQIVADGQAAIEKALFSPPREPLLLGVMGELFYRTGQHQQALTWFERALSLSPDLPWACLWRAHVLRELQQWTAAVTAYDAVPVDRFVGPAVWRASLVKEQRGWCRVQAGQHAVALRDFLSALEDYEQDLTLAEQGMSRILITVALRVYPRQLRARTLRVARSIGWMWAVDMLSVPDV